MDEPSPAPPRRDRRLLLLLVMLALGFRAWQLTHTEVAARDCIAYVRMAWKLEHGDWRQVVREGPHHPAYPLAVLAASAVVRRVDPGPLPEILAGSGITEFLSSR